MNHHVLPLAVCINRKLELEVEPGLKPKHFNTRYGYSKQQLNSHANIHHPQIYNIFNVMKYYAATKITKTVLIGMINPINIILNKKQLFARGYLSCTVIYIKYTARLTAVTWPIKLLPVTLES